MAKKEVIWSTRASIEFKEVLEFYIERNGNPDYSLKILTETEDLLETLSKSEFIGRLTSNRRTRVIPKDDFLIFYEVFERQIQVVSFWDNRQGESKRMDI